MRKKAMTGRRGWSERTQKPHVWWSCSLGTASPLVLESATYCLIEQTKFRGCLESSCPFLPKALCPGLFFFFWCPLVRKGRSTRIPTAGLTFSTPRREVCQATHMPKTIFCSTILVETAHSLNTTANYSNWMNNCVLGRFFPWYWFQVCPGLWAVNLIQRDCFLLVSSITHRIWKSFCIVPFSIH